MNKTDKQLVWESIKAIEEHTLNFYNNFKILSEHDWKNWTDEDKLRIRGLLLTNGLVEIIGNSQWAFRLTPIAMVLKERDLKANGTIKKKHPNKQFWLGVTAALIGAVTSTGLSAILEVWKARHPKEPQSKTIVLPKIQIVHDTVWLKKNLPKKP